MKILHIASFSGNIGDNANHNGFKKLLSSITKEAFIFKKVEIRDFYQSRNILSFNKASFIEECNRYDLVVIGGGNFFEINWDYSETGSTINISLESLSNIKTPILFNALGFDDYKGTNKNNIDKFKHFLDFLNINDKYFISLRNDGSYENLNRIYPKHNYQKIIRVPDPAFFSTYKKIQPFYIDDSKKYVGINLVKDFVEIRYKNESKYNDFIKKTSRVFNDFLSCNKDYNLILFSHVHRDLIALADFTQELDDIISRERVITAPYLSGEKSEEYIFGLYQNCELIVGMRFHSNVLALAMGIKTVAISSFKKIDNLYEELNLQDKIIDIHNPRYEKELSYKIKNTLNSKKTNYLWQNNIKKEFKNYQSHLLDWLHLNKIVK